MSELILPSVKPPPPPDDPLVAFIKNANLSLWNPDVHQSGMEPECRRYYFFGQRLRLRTPKRARALDLGGFFHTAMQAYYLADGQPAAMPAEVENAIDLKTAELAEFADVHQTLPDGRTLTEYRKDMTEDGQKALAMAEILVAKHPLPPKYKVVKVEHPLHLALADLTPGVDYPAHLPATLNLGGKLDLLLQDDEGCYWIVDWKTTSYNPLTVAAMYPFSKQLRTYRILAHYNYAVGSLNGIRGFIHCVIRKPAIKYCSKDGGVWANYVQRCVEWYADQEQLPGAGPSTVLSQVRFTEPLWTDEYCQQLLTAWALANGRPSAAGYYRNERACLGRYGNSLCPYFAFCGTSPAAWKSVFDAKFIQSPPSVEEESSDPINQP